jgi:lipopolysaccharide export system protein LptC
MHLLKDAWERFLLYLPVAFMVLLALSSYWLVRSTPVPTTSDIQRPVRHDPDYFLEGFALKTFDASGRIRTEVLGDKARHYPDTQWLEIDGIRIRSFDDKGRLTTARADRGLTNEDTSQVQLIGGAVVVREAEASDIKPVPRMEFRGEFLHAFMQTEIVKSHKPVQLQRGADHFSADSLEFDNVDQVLQLKGRVRASLVPEKP